MKARICVKRVDAAFENGVWTCPDRDLRDYLEIHSQQCPIARDEVERHVLWVCVRAGGAMLSESAPPAPVSPPRGIIPRVRKSRHRETDVFGG